MQTCASCIAIAGLRGDMLELENLLQLNYRLDRHVVLQKDLIKPLPLQLTCQFTPIKDFPEMYSEPDETFRGDVENLIVTHLKNDNYSIPPDRCNHYRDRGECPTKIISKL